MGCLGGSELSVTGSIVAQVGQPLCSDAKKGIQARASGGTRTFRQGLSSLNLYYERDPSTQAGRGPGMGAIHLWLTVPTSPFPSRSVLSACLPSGSSLCTAWSSC